MTASLLRSMDPAAVTLADALRVLSLPRVVGVDPANGEDIVASNGRYGPYLRRGSNRGPCRARTSCSRSGSTPALALFAQPAARRGRGAAAAPLRDLGPDPQSGAPILLREGRFGPYVTDGTTNASLRKGDTVEDLTPERAIELLADRRAAGPRPARGRGATRKASAAAKNQRRGQEDRRPEDHRDGQEGDRPGIWATTAKGSAAAAPAARKTAGPAKKASGATKKAAGATKKTAGPARKRAPTAKSGPAPDGSGPAHRPGGRGGHGQIDPGRPAGGVSGRRAHPGTGRYGHR